ncbi:hypothetical protein B0E54_06363 [Micromonospora sp. MH99]|nr:hypothetical protein [Micromonospora sp. MH99]
MLTVLLVQLQDRVLVILNVASLIVAPARVL